MNKLTTFLLSTVFLLLGIIIGFLLAPIKKGLSCGNNNGSTYIYKSEDDDNDENDDN